MGSFGSIAEGFSEREETFMGFSDSFRDLGEVDRGRWGFRFRFGFTSAHSGIIQAI
jgi:hypothetical protein